ncbi:IclR family transcriptional regulator [Roseibium aggregatum]|uniref:IclR family transcriptional regulator n=1 Tax=Roseibium aggregatum TaxID=187304 RepID=UPI001E530995|nr:IclR family transcriptional regulator [Roseibium aggregatum]UES53682.1 helix-turn-helix domain-containing protein [Roseibium aggregatum]
MKEIKNSQPAQAKGVEAVDRALRILQCFHKDDGRLGLAEIAARTGFYKSTILRLIVSLEAQGFLRRAPDKSYGLGPELLRLGSIYRQSLRIEEHVRPALRRLLDITGESASFFIEQADKRICLFREDSLQPVRDHVAEGEILALNQGAAGHVLVDYKQCDAIGVPISTANLPRFSFGERTPDVAAAAVPVFGLEGANTVLLGALTISGPMSRFTPELCEKISAPLLLEGKSLSACFGANLDWQKSEAR